MKKIFALLLICSMPIGASAAAMISSPTIDSSVLKVLADAIVKAGAAPTSVALPLNYKSGRASDTTSISGVFGEAISAIRNLHLIGALLILENPSCAAGLDEARAQALASAHGKAAKIAKQLGVILGKALSVYSRDRAATDGACTSQYWMGPLGLQYEQIKQGVAHPYVAIPVSSSVTIKFAITWVRF